MKGDFLAKTTITEDCGKSSGMRIKLKCDPSKIAKERLEILRYIEILDIFNTDNTHKNKGIK